MNNYREQIEQDLERLKQKQKDYRAEVKQDIERLKQQQRLHNQKIETDIKLTSPKTSLDNFDANLISSQKNISAEGLGFIGGGALAGVSTSAIVGGMGLVGSFGGIGLGLGTMTGAGVIIGASTYGAYQAIRDEDATALWAIGLGALGGVGISATVGGMGLSVGGTAFGIGMSSMAAAGGIIGLGIYGLTKIFTNESRETKMYRNLQFLEKITREYEEERKWADLESGYLGIEAELQAMKATLKQK